MADRFTLRPVGHAIAALVASVAVAAAFAAGQVAFGQVATNNAANNNTDARVIFEAATSEMKDLVGELAVLQAKYHQPGADKSAIEARFNETAVKAQAASERLEQAAFAMVETDPANAEAREICGAVAASALQNDDPLRAVATIERLEAAQATDVNTLLLAASAATLAAPQADAAAWLEKAVAAGAKPDQVADIRGLIDAQASKVAAEKGLRAAEAAADDLPRVRVSTSAGDVVVELFENEAPNTVANFVNLVEKGFYDGTPFHRVIGGFMAQGGDPTGTGTGGPGHAIACECDRPDARQHFLGTLSMAHAGKNTGGSQFFLTFRPTDHLDGRHTVFGRVVEGFDVLPQLTRTQDDEGRSVPGVKPDKIVKAEMIRKRDHAYDPQTLPDPRK
jgi:cyclophilin family peptidyl-prolyl cis-trans isomerase